MKWLKLSLLALGLTFAALPAGSQERPSTPEFEAASQELVCQCGCNLSLATCGMDQCHSALPMREEIQRRLAAGESKAAIVASFVDRYGLSVLSAPPASGFNLSAWIAPFAALLVGLFITQKVLSSWKRQTARVTPAEPSQPPPVSDEVRARIEKELRDFEA